MEIHFSTTVNRPIERVFTYVGNPERWPQFETDFLEIRPLASDAKRAGATYRFKRKMPGRVVEGQFELTEYLSNQKIMMQCGGWSKRFRDAKIIKHPRAPPL